MNMWRFSAIARSVMISARMLTSIYESRTGSFSAIARSVMISAIQDESAVKAVLSFQCYSS